MLVRLEMDEQPMIFLLLAPAACLVAGTSLGVAHFGSLWRAARLLTGRGPGLTTIALMIARWALLGGALALASLEGGAAPLLAMALGVLIGRSLVMRRVRAPTP
jgi:hypothetical protein